MRKITFKLAMLFLMVLSVSCVKKEYITVEPKEEPKDNSSYTIMMYGCGGGNLDMFMVNNIREALLAGSTDRVKFTGQVKFSKAFQDYEETSGTQRFVVGPATDKWYTPVEVLDTELPLYDPQSLTDFINWSKEQCPADEYILILWNHGGGWTPWGDGNSVASRAVVYDDVLNDRGLTLDDLVKGINDSGTKMKMIYYDACLMGMVEIMSALTECADYVLSASHITPGLGGDYSSLMYYLNNSTNFVEAIKTYCFETVSHWNTQGLPGDLTLVDTSKMDNLLSEISVFSGYLKEMMPAALKYAQDPGSVTPDEMVITSTLMKGISNCYMYETSYMEFPFFDLLNFAEILANGAASTYSAKLVDIASRLNRAFNEVIVYQKLSNIIVNKLDLSLAVTIVDAGRWGEHYYDGIYSKLKFDEVTNWGEWLSINPIVPTGNPNPDTFMDNFEGAGGDEDEEGDEEGDGEGDGEGDEDEDGDDELLIQLVLEIINSSR